jgi:superfamily II DNA or RNA helicase
LSPQTTLREQQQLAASKALGGEISFIIGPPGTGKTLTLAAIALTHLRQGRTVLIAAHTNIAVDNAIMKLCDLCKEAGRNDLLTQGQVIRFGVVQKAELKGDSYQEVYLPRIVQHLNAQLQKEYDNCKHELDALTQQIGTLPRQMQADK